MVPSKLAVVLRKRAEVKEDCDDHKVGDKAEPAAQDEREDGDDHKVGDKAKPAAKEKRKDGDTAEEERKVGDKAEEERKVGDKAEKERKVGDKAEPAQAEPQAELQAEPPRKRRRRRRVLEAVADEELSLMLRETDEVLAICNEVIARSESAMGFEP